MITVQSKAHLASWEDLKRLMNVRQPISVPNAPLHWVWAEPDLSSLIRGFFPGQTRGSLCKERVTQHHYLDRGSRPFLSLEKQDGGMRLSTLKWHKVIDAGRAHSAVLHSGTPEGNFLSLVTVPFSAELKRERLPSWEEPVFQRPGFRCVFKLTGNQTMGIVLAPPAPVGFYHTIVPVHWSFQGLQGLALVTTSHFSVPL